MISLRLTFHALLIACLLAVFAMLGGCASSTPRMADVRAFATDAPKLNAYHELTERYRSAYERQQPGGVAQIGNIGGARLLGRQAGRDFSGHAVYLLHPQHQRVIARGGHAGLEFVAAVRVAGHAALARVPVARVQVEQHQLQAMLAQLRGDLLGGPCIGEQEFDSLEAGGAGCAKAVEEGDVGKQHRQVGGKFRHGQIIRQ